MGALEDRVAALESRVQELEDINAVRRLHFTYGYFIDKALYDEAVDLFADDGEVRFVGGVYKGKEGVRRLYCTWFRDFFTQGVNGPAYGFLLDHILCQDVIHVESDGKTAHLRARGLLLGGSHHSRKHRPLLPDQFWEGGIHANTYVKEDGVWKIKVLDYQLGWQAEYEKGWADSDVHIPPHAGLYPDNPIGPDEYLDDRDRGYWPDTPVVPFHYPHPVTGKPVSPDTSGQGQD